MDLPESGDQEQEAMSDTQGMIKSPKKAKHFARTIPNQPCSKLIDRIDALKSKIRSAKAKLFCGPSIKSDLTFT